MSLDYILLGMLQRPASGYDLKTEFEQGTRHFWAAEFSQIYPALNRLEDRGWLTSRTEPSVRGPERRVYTRTAKGQAELFRWLQSSPAMATERFAYIGQLIYMGELNDLTATREFLSRLRDQLSERAEVLRTGYNAMRAIPGCPDSLDATDLHSYLALRIGIESIDGRIRGCDACLDMVYQRLQKEATRV